MPNREKSQAVFARAMKVLSKDVSSNFRYWGPDSCLSSAATIASWTGCLEALFRFLLRKKQ